MSKKLIKFKVEYFFNNEWLTAIQLHEHFKKLYPDCNKNSVTNKKMTKEVMNVINNAQIKLHREKKH